MVHVMWRVRTNLPDRPGSLAALTRACGEARVNILGLQIFPEIGSVTDELVLRAPDDWTAADVARLLAGAGGREVTVVAATEAALLDQPTRYVHAARTVLGEPARFTEIVADLFDAGPGRPVGGDGGEDVMDLRVGDVAVQVRRPTPFTATEHARGAALATLVSDVLDRTRPEAPLGGGGAGRRLGQGAVPEHVRVPGGVEARVAGAVVGVAVIGPPDPGGGRRPVRLRVDPAWRRRGVGTRLLVDLAREAGAAGEAELVLVTDADNQAVLPMMLAAGLRGRIRMSEGRLTVTIPVPDRAAAGSGPSPGSALRDAPRRSRGRSAR